MAILTSAEFTAASGLAPTGDDAASLDALCAAVDAAIKRVLRPFHPEPLTCSNVVLDAPYERELYLPVTPVRGVTSIYYRSDANGLAANFTSDYLIDNTDGAAYQLVIDDWVNNYSRRGLVRRVGEVWAWERFRPAERLGYRLGPERGSLLVNFTAGPTSVPLDVQQAAVVAATLLYQRRKTGVPLASESWGGYSYSAAGQFTAEAAVRSPEVAALLAPYTSIHVG